MDGYDRNPRRRSEQTDLWDEYIKDTFLIYLIRLLIRLCADSILDFALELFYFLFDLTYAIVLLPFKLSADALKSAHLVPIASPGFPRFWSLFGYLLPRETRVRVFDPRQQELLEDYTLARRSYRTIWARRWLVFCFTFRTALMVLECFRAMAVDKMFWWVPWIR